MVVVGAAAAAVVALGAAVLAAKTAFRCKYFATIATNTTPYHIFIEIRKLFDVKKSLQKRALEDS